VNWGDVNVVIVQEEKRRNFTSISLSLSLCASHPGCCALPAVSVPLHPFHYAATRHYTNPNSIACLPAGFFSLAPLWGRDLRQLLFRYSVVSHMMSQPKIKALQARAPQRLGLRRTRGLVSPFDDTTGSITNFILNITN